MAGAAMPVGAMPAAATATANQLIQANSNDSAYRAEKASSSTRRDGGFRRLLGAGLPILYMPDAALLAETGPHRTVLSLSQEPGRIPRQAERMFVSLSGPLRAVSGATW
jgi:hypothetical protein